MLNGVEELGLPIDFTSALCFPFTVFFTGFAVNELV